MASPASLPPLQISYAQNGEDIRLSRVLTDGSGVYIDVGAASPTVGSVTRYFYAKGWRGTNIEPLPRLFQQLCAERPRDVNLNAVASSKPGQLPLYECIDEPELSTLDRDGAEELTERWGHSFAETTVTAISLAELFARHHHDHVVDFLKVDVEGHETDVLASGDWSRWRPRIVVVEATKPRSQQPTHEAWEPMLLAADYRFAAWDGLNRYYVRAEDEALAPGLAEPVSAFDRFVPFRFYNPFVQLGRRLRRALGDDLDAEVRRILDEVSAVERDPSAFRRWWRSE